MGGSRTDGKKKKGTNIGWEGVKSIIFCRIVIVIEKGERGRDDVWRMRTGRRGRPSTSNGVDAETTHVEQERGGGCFPSRMLPPGKDGREGGKARRWRGCQWRIP